jgi:hypothetical protein
MTSSTSWNLGEPRAISHSAMALATIIRMRMNQLNTVKTPLECSNWAATTLLTATARYQNDLFAIGEL